MGIKIRELNQRPADCGGGSFERGKREVQKEEMELHLLLACDVILELFNPHMPWPHLSAGQG